MARIRTIKPEFWKHEELSALPEATHMLAAALLNYADDFGYFNANPGLIRGEVSPLREPSVSIPESLRSLQTIGYIELGTGPEGKRYGRIVTFSEHQRVSHPTPSKIQELSIVWDGSNNPPEKFAKPPETFVPEMEQGTGNKEQGTGNGESARKRTPPTTRGTRLANDWQPDEQNRELARSLGLDADAEFAAFADHFRAEPGQRGVKVDWGATFRNWCRRSAKFSGGASRVRGVDRVEESAARVRSKAVALARATPGFGGPLEPPESPGDAGTDRASDRGFAGPLLDAHAERGDAGGDDGGLDSGDGGSAAVGPGCGVQPVADRPGNGAAETPAGGHSGAPAGHELDIPDFLRRAPGRLLG